MAARPLEPRLAAEAYNRIVSYGNALAAARSLGLPRGTLQNRVERARQYLQQGALALDHRGFAHVGEASDEPNPETSYAPPRIHVTVSHLKTDPQGDYNVFCIGDAHDGPLLPKDRFRWLGRHAHETEPDYIVQIGDLFTFDSLCKYDGNETLKGKSKPAYEDDVESGHEALTAFDEGLDGYECPKHSTLGNHEDRAFSFTNRTPETAGILTGMLDNLYMSHGWTFSPYGEVYFIASVGFVHVPLNRLGKPYGGKTALDRIANDAIHDVVYGHDHLGGYKSSPKIGRNQKVTVLNTGCALPEGHVEPYVGHGMSGWWYGAVDLKIRGGRLHSWQYHPMSELEKSYA